MTRVTTAGGLPLITEEQAIRIAHDDAVRDYDANLDLHWNTSDPIRSFDAAANEWKVRFPLKVPSRGGSPKYRIDGSTGAIRARIFDL